MHSMRFRAEGFDIHKLLSLCLKENIELQKISIRSSLEFTGEVRSRDWAALLRVAGSRYRITMIKEKGLTPTARRILKRGSTVAGIAVFLLFLFLQTTFISEIRVYGYEKLTEKEILTCLKDAGLYVGCSRKIDLDSVEISMYRSMDKISWIGITLNGGLAQVVIAEGTVPVETDQGDQPCHIVAAKEGYIEKAIAREGKEVVVKDDFVHVGDVLISGIIKIEDKTYSRGSQGVLSRYVQADGEVYARTIYRFICYQETRELRKEKTGRSMPGLRLTLGSHTWSTANLLVPYETSAYEEKELFKLFWPFPLELAVTRISELSLSEMEREPKEIEKQANRQARELIRDNIPGSAQIRNKSLKFLPGENIIKVTILIEALEQIGEKRPFIPFTDENGVL